MNIKITTWNILADAYIRNSRYESSSSDDLKGAARDALILETISAQASDVYCLQEVEPKAYEAIAAHLAKTHRGSFVQKRNKPEGSAIFVNNTIDAVFSELHFENVSDGKNQVASLAELTVDGERVGVASTHLQWMKDSTPRQNHLGRLQLIELMEHVGSVACPWILCGDFNANSQSVVIDAAAERGYLLSCRHQRPWDSTNINGRRRKIDYLLFPAASEFSVDPDPLPQLEKNTPMPSKIYASDHLPVSVRFTK